MLFRPESPFMVMKVIPVLPANIIRMITSLPGAERHPVSPLESPTVPKAETASKNKSPVEKIPFSREDFSAKSSGID